ncbi:MAG TPA: hypothetical protein VIJ85_05260 [Rhizomicrobium sp.]
MTDQTADRSRMVGAVLFATAIASAVLLLNHPAESATDFAGMLKEEAANQIKNAVVHGGFTVVLAIQLACYAIFSSRLGWQRGLAIAGLVFFAIGAALQTASLVVDGLVIPQLAVRYLASPPDHLPFAKSLFVLCGTAIQFLMPMGLFWQGAGITAWGAAAMRLVRAGGLAGLLIGLAVMAGAVAALAGQMVLMMLAIVGMALWAAVAGALMFRRAI